MYLICHCRYTDLIKGNLNREFAEAHAYHNMGMLHEILGNPQEALESYKKFFQMSKKKSDKKGVALAYGCLGSAYAALHNRQMAVTYHEQHVASAKKLKDSR